MSTKRSATKLSTPKAPPVSPASPVRGDAEVGIVYFRIGAVVVFLISLVLYVKTMAASSSFWDSGEFIATSYTLGIPHSPGTPLYVLIGRVFSLLPLPFSIAARVNFMSVISGALGALFLYLLVIRFLDHMLGRSESTIDTIVKVAGALVGALFITFSNTYWTNATEAEVYAMSTFIMGLMTWLGLRWAANPTGTHATSFIYFVIYLLALSVGLHLGTILAFSGIFFLVLMTRDKTFSNYDFLLACLGIGIFVADATLYRAGHFTLTMLAIFAVLVFIQYGRKKSVFAAVCTGLFILGISVHLYLKIRSVHNPLIDEGDPESWRWLYAALRREQYPPSNILERKASFAFQLQHFNGYFQSQFQMLAQYVGKLNLGSAVPIGLGIWGMVDQYSKHRKTFVMLFTTFLVMSLGMILYLNFSDSEVRERDYFYLPAFYYFAVYIGIGAGSILAEIKQFATRAGMNRQTAVAVPALVLIVMPFFTAKHHYWSHDRSKNRICQKYARNMLVGLEENAILFTNGDNDTFPLWYIQEVEKYRTDIRVVNLSLLNTPWYLKQLRDNKPSVKIVWTDEELYRLTPVRTRDGVLMVRDLGVQHILKYNSKDRPIYFAVTIPPEIFAPYRSFLEMEGLAYRVVPRKGENMVDKKKLQANVWSNFDFGGLLKEVPYKDGTTTYKRDDSIYRPPFVSRLVQNYAAAFTQLAFVQVQDENYCEAAKNLEVAREISPNITSVNNWIGYYYLECGDTLGGLGYYDDLYKETGDPELLYRKAGLQERIGDLEAALSTLERIVAAHPQFRDAVMSSAAILARFGEYDRALKYINDWLATHPNDKGMLKGREDVLNRKNAPDTTRPPNP